MIFLKCRISKSFLSSNKCENYSRKKDMIKSGGENIYGGVLMSIQYLDDDFLEECIYDSLMLLMKRCRFEQVSIADICRKAGVSRMTYYRKFNCKEEIIVKHLNKVFKRYKVSLYEIGNSSTLENGEMFFEYFSHLNRLIYNLINSDMEYLLTYQFTVYLKELKYQIQINDYYSSSQSSYWIEYYAAALSKLLITWIKNGMIETCETMARYLVNFRSNYVVSAQ